MRWPLLAALALMLPLEARAFPVDLDATHEILAAKHAENFFGTPQETSTPMVRHVLSQSVGGAAGVLPDLPDGFVAQAMETRATAPTPVRRIENASPAQSAPGGQTDAPTPGESDASNVRLQRADTTGQILFPLSADVGAAAFQRRDRMFVFFRTTMSIALPAAGGMFLDATVKSLPDIEMVSFTVPSGRSLRLCRVKAGWLLADAALATCSEAPAIVPVERSGALWFAATSPDRVVHVADPETAAPLLVGLVTDDRSGRVATSVVSTSGDVLPSVLGVVVEVGADRLTLQRREGGFELGPWASGQPVSARDALTVNFTRTLNLPDESAEAARLRLEAVRRLIGTNEVAARASILVEAATAAIGTGDGELALHYTALARSQGPSDNRASRQIALIDAIAHSLDGRAVADDAAVAGQSDEDSAWRDVAASDKVGAQSSRCMALASAVRLFAGYPEPLRHRVLPEVAERVAQCGTGSELDAVANLGEDPALRYAKALAKLRRLGSKSSLDELDALSRDRDPVTAYKAEMRDIGERVLRKSMTARQAADRLEDLVFAARMAGDAERWRSEMAGDLAAAGERERAVEVLKQARPMTPDLRERARDLLRQIAAERSADPGDRLKNAAKLLGNVDLLNPLNGPADDLRVQIGETLLADGFPNKALDILPQTETDADVAGRVRIASARASAALAVEDPKTALAALAMIREPIDVEEHQRRSFVLLQARAHEAANDCDGALQRLSGGGDDLKSDSTFQSDADTLAARCMARLGRWTDAMQPLSRLTRRIRAGREALSDADQDVVMRYATAASNAGDQALVNELVATYGPRIDPGLQSALNALAGASGGAAATTQLAQH